jgi:hypothetical protein
MVKVKGYNNAFQLQVQVPGIPGIACFANTFRLYRLWMIEVASAWSDVDAGMTMKKEIIDVSSSYIYILSKIQRK